MGDDDAAGGGPAPVTGDGAGPAPGAGEAPRGRGWRRILLTAAIVAVALFAVAQLVPYGRAHSNPPVTAEPAWNTPATQALFTRACGDCHSNLTTWPWYSNVAPVSWLVTNDVNGGRSNLNVSEWNRPQEAAGDVAEAIQAGDMPPVYYTWMHSTAKLSSAEKAALVKGWEATMAASPPIGGGG